MHFLGKEKLWGRAKLSQKNSLNEKNMLVSVVLYLSNLVFLIFCRLKTVTNVMKNETIDKSKHR
jgi:hypothetical protein